MTLSSSTLQKITFGSWELFVRFLSPTSGVCSVGVRIQVGCSRDVVHAVNGACSVFHVTEVLYVFHEMNNDSTDSTDKPSSKYRCNLIGISPVVNTHRRFRYLKLSQLSPTPPFLRLPSWIKEEWERYLESYNLTHTLKTLRSFYCICGDYFPAFGATLLMRWMVPLLPEGTFWRKSAVGLFRGGIFIYSIFITAYLFLWQWQSKGLDSLRLNVLGIVILVFSREKHIFLKSSSGHRWVCAWCKLFGVHTRERSAQQCPKCSPEAQVQVCHVQNRAG